MSGETPELPRTDEAKRRMLEALQEMPVTAAACRRAGISRATYYRWRQEDPAFLQDSDQAYRDGIEFMSDMSEAQILSQIKDKNIQAAIFWLKHHRAAYGGKAELERQSGEEPLTDEQKRLIRKALAAFTPARSKP